MKGLFATPKRAVISTLCIVFIALAIIVMIIYFTMRGGLIGKAEASDIALDEAGLDEDDVSSIRTELDFDDGRFQYEIKFFKDSTEYEYIISAKDGDILEIDIDGKRADGIGHLNTGGTDNTQPAADSSAQTDNAAQTTAPADTPDQTDTLPPKTAAPADTTPADTQAPVDTQAPDTQAPADTSSAEISRPQADEPAQIEGITLEKAKAIALGDAGVAEADASFTKQQLDRDDLFQVFDIEFTTDSAKYEYEINAADGTIHERDIEVFKKPEKTDSTASDDGYIGVDKAKEIAFADAGVSAADVTVTKAKLDKDDGIMEYEIEFYSGRTEYEYSINAQNGTILDHDVDYD